MILRIYLRRSLRKSNVPSPFGIPARVTLSCPLNHVWEASACISFYGTRSLLPARPCRPKRISCAKAIVLVAQGHSKGVDGPSRNIIYLYEGRTLKTVSGLLWGSSGRRFRYWVLLKLLDHLRISGLADGYYCRTYKPRQLQNCICNQ